MRENKRPIVIYWSPATFSKEDESWNLLYRDPENVFSSIIKNTIPKFGIRECPAVKDNLKNVFTIKSNHEDHIKLHRDLLEDHNVGLLPTESVVTLRHMRQSSYPGYANLFYNMRWAFFSSEPVIARMSSPYYPATTPTPGAIMATGQYDIGQWFRYFDLDYHVPIDSTSFDVNIGDDLMFIEIMTDRKVIFKRFWMTNAINHMAYEMSSSTGRYQINYKTLQHRYNLFNKTSMRQMLLREIEANLIPEI
jgi:hypothetical protein